MVIWSASLSKNHKSAKVGLTAASWFLNREFSSISETTNIASRRTRLKLWRTTGNLPPIDTNSSGSVWIPCVKRGISKRSGVTTRRPGRFGNDVDPELKFLDERFLA